MRALYLLSIRHAVFFAHPLTEAQRYQEWALAILRGEVGFRSPFDEAPAYPYFVAGLFALFGRAPISVAAVQAIIDAGSCAALALLGRRLGGARTGWIAGALAAIYGPLVSSSAELLPTALSVFAVSAALLATPAENATARRWTLAGCAWAAALCVRSEIVLALPVVFLHAALAGGRRMAARAAIAPAAFLAASLLVNYASSGYPVVLTTGGGVNLWIGNNPAADGVSPFIHGPMEAFAGQVTQQARDSVQADQLFRAEAVRYLRDQPGKAARLALRKFVWLWTDRELPNTSDIDWQNGQSWLFHPPFFPLHFGLLFPLALAGALLLGRRWRSECLLAAPAAIALVTSVLFFTNARFRLPLVAAMVPLGAFAVDRLIQLLPRWREERRTLALAGAGILAGLAACYSDFDGVRGYRIPQIDVNTAALERQAGNLDGAVIHLRLALDRDGSDASTWSQLAIALEQSGQPGEAQATIDRAVLRLPDDQKLRRLAAALARQHGDRTH